jgi:hypothetical protein
MILLTHFYSNIFLQILGAISHTVPAVCDVWAARGSGFAQQRPPAQTCRNEAWAQRKQTCYMTCQPFIIILHKDKYYLIPMPFFM